MRHYKDHLIISGTSLREALEVLEELAIDAITFVVDEEQKLIGSLTDGDIRRGLIDGVELNQPVDDIIQTEPRFIRKGDQDISKVIGFRENNLKIIPILDIENRVVNVINFRELKSYLPIDVVVMAGGKGTRLLPLTENTPKPLLKVGNKPILEHIIYYLSLFGIDDFWITVNYLGEQIEKHFGNGNHKNLHIEYVKEDIPMGTIGSVSKISNFRHDYILIMNSDILTNMNYEAFLLRFLEEEADFAVVTIPYKVSVPYAVLETANGHVVSLKEKPTYTYYSNGGIYLMKREIAKNIPKNNFYDATDLMEKLIKMGKKVISYPLSDYWIDIGKEEDYKRANLDIRKLF